MKASGLLIGLMAVPAVVMIGCGPVTPAAEAVLAGRWELIQTEDTQLGQTFIVFDANGRLSELITVIGGITIRRTALVGTTTVVGSNVTVSLGFDANNLSFVGVLNPAQDAADGTLSTNISIGSTTIGIDEGAARLVRQ